MPLESWSLEDYLLSTCVCFHSTFVLIKEDFWRLGVELQHEGTAVDAGGGSEGRD